MKYFISFIAGFIACIIFITSIFKKIENLINKMRKCLSLEIILCDELIPSCKKFIFSSIEYLLYGNTLSSRYRYNKRYYYREEGENE